jgi:hypothetical protein
MLHDGTIVIVHDENLTLNDLVGSSSVSPGVSTSALVRSPRVSNWSLAGHEEVPHIDWSKAEPCAPRLDVRLRIVHEWHVDHVDMIDAGEGEVEDGIRLGSWEMGKVTFYTCEVDGQHVSLRESCQLRGSEQQQTSESESMEKHHEANLTLGGRSPFLHIFESDWVLVGRCERLW